MAACQTVDPAVHPGSVPVTVHVRLFAALREAAGAEYVDVEATTAAAREMAAVSDASRRADEARRAVEAADAEHRNATAALQEIELRRDRASAAKSTLAEELEGLTAAEPDPSEAATDDDAFLLADREAQAEEARRERATAVAERDRTRDAWVAAQADARGREERQVGQQRERATLELRREQLRAEVPRLRQAREAVESERRGAEEALTSARLADDEASGRRRAADEARQAARAELLEMERGAGGGMARLGEPIGKAHV